MVAAIAGDADTESTGIIRDPPALRGRILLFACKLIRKVMYQHRIIAQNRNRTEYLCLDMSISFEIN